MPGCLYLPVPEPWEALSLQQLAFRELGQTVKKDHQPSGTDPSGERVIATENTWMAMADPERASSGAEEVSCCGGPVSESTQCSCQRDGAKTSFQKHTERMLVGQSQNQLPKAHRVHVSGTERQPVSKNTQTEHMSAGWSNKQLPKAHRAHVSGTEWKLSKSTETEHMSAA